MYVRIRASARLARVGHIRADVRESPLVRGEVVVEAGLGVLDRVEHEQRVEDANLRGMTSFTIAMATSTTNPSRESKQQWVSRGGGGATRSECEATPQ